MLKIMIVGEDCMTLYADLAARYSDLTEISGRSINEADLRALGMINCTALTRAELEKANTTYAGMNRLRKGDPNLKSLSSVYRSKRERVDSIAVPLH